jgi:hypothetical protein
VVEDIGSLEADGMCSAEVFSYKVHNTDPQLQSQVPAQLWALVA